MDESPLAALLAGGSQTSDVAVNQAQRRKLAEAMATAGLDTSPVGHWTQALARVLQAGAGASLNRQLDTEEANRRTALANLLAGGGQTSVAAAPATVPSNNQQPTVAPDQSPQSSPRSALLAAISGGEAPDYNVLYGGKTFASYADHPRQAVPITSGPYAGQTSSAAGKYQFLAPTWDAEAKKLGLKDFSPASQDAAAWDLAATTYKAKTGRDLEGDLKAGRTEDVSRALKGVWPSLPGGDQPNRATGNFGSRLAQALSGVSSDQPMAFSGEPLPSGAPVTPAALAPPQQVAAAQPQLPPQAQQAQQILSQIPPEVRAQAKQLVLAGMESEAVKLLQPYYKPVEYGFQTAPDGTIFRTNSRTGEYTPIGQAPVKPTFGVIGEDPLTQTKQYGFTYPDGRIVPASQAMQGPAGTPGVRTASADEGGAWYLGKGVSAINSDLQGDEYLNQFAPEVRSAVKNYLKGVSIPTGNARKGFTDVVKKVAGKYAEDTGTPFDETIFKARQNLRTELSSGKNSPLGGQILLGNTALEHLDGLSKRALALENVNFMGPDVSHIINAARGHLSTDQAAKLDSLKTAALRYGQEGTKFYANSPGGVEERTKFLEAVNGAKTPQELAAVISTEMEYISGKVHSIEGHIRQTLGEEGVKEFPVIRSEGQQHIKNIQENVARLRGEKPSETTRGMEAKSIPDAAIADLMAKPELASHFDAIFGPGAAAKVLGGK